MKQAERKKVELVVSEEEDVDDVDGDDDGDDVQPPKKWSVKG